MATASPAGADCVAAGDNPDGDIVVGTLDCETDGANGGGGGPDDLWWDCQYSTETVVANDHTTAVFPGGNIVTPYTPPANGLESIETLIETVDGQGAAGDIVIVNANPQSVLARLFSETGTWVRTNCIQPLDINGNAPGDLDFEPTQPGTGTVTVVGAIGPGGGGAISLEGLINNAYTTLDPVEPPEVIHSPADFAVAQAPTVLSVDEVWWEDDYISRASIGPTWVDVYALPDTFEFDAADGSGMVCDGRGMEFTLGMSVYDPDLCTYIYTMTSTFEPADTFTVSIDVEMATAWVTNVPGYGVNPLDPINRITFSPLQVGEIQALIVGDGS